ncbi:MAG TPA: HEAT repeat domain-containing protein [Gemmatimonadales bacterium]|jgi:TolA-binding protein
MSSFLSLLLAVTTLAQDSVAPPPARKHRRTPTVTIAPMTPLAPMTIALPDVQAVTIAPMTIAAAELQNAAAALVMAQPQLEAIAVQAPLMIAQAPMALAAQQLQIAATAIAPLGAFGDDDWEDQTPQEPADSFYQAGRRALNRNRYQDAITAFGQVISRYPRSARAPEALYWSSFALYRTGDTKNLQTAVSQLARLRQTYPDAAVRDAENLAARIDGVLAQRGDAEAAQRNQARADSARSSDNSKGRSRDRARERDEGNDETPAGCEGYGEDDPRIIALGALLQMNAESAIPILHDVLKRRDPCSEIMRRKAVFIVSQKRSDETAKILLDAARQDPDREVRKQAVFWLSQVPGEETVAALDSILSDSKTDQDTQDQAIFALSQHRSPRAGAILRAYAERADRPLELRKKAVFGLSQNRSAQNAQFLKDLFKKVDNDELKEHIIFSLSQIRDETNYRWMMDIALDESENIEIRKKALFWANQGGNKADIADLVRLYDSMKNREMRDQLIFLYSQRREDAALDKLFQIGKSDPDRELRKQAIFWIGQSRSPRAAAYLQELINQ